MQYRPPFVRDEADEEEFMAMSIMEDTAASRVPRPETQPAPPRSPRFPRSTLAPNPLFRVASISTASFSTTNTTTAATTTIPRAQQRHLNLFSWRRYPQPAAYPRSAPPNMDFWRSVLLVAQLLLLTAAFLGSLLVCYTSENVVVCVLMGLYCCLAGSMLVAIVAMLCISGL